MRRNSGKASTQAPSHGAKGCASNMADNPASPLTTDTLIRELEKFRKTMTGELTSLLNDSLEPIRSSVQSIETTLTSQASTIREMETSLSDHSGRIIQVEHDVGELQSNLKSVIQENAALKAKVEDLESRSKRQNLRVLGLPENIEGKDPRDFVAKMFSSLLGELLSAPPELDRAHRSLQPKPRPGDPPRPFIVRFHRYIDKEIVLNWAKTHKDISYNSIRIRIFEDFSVAVTKKRLAFNEIKGLLYKRGVKFGMLYPARLRVTYGNREHIFNSAGDAQAFFQERILSSEKCTAEVR